MKKYNAKRCLKILSVVLALLVFVSVSQIFFFRHFSGAQARIDGFYLEEKNSLDVVFIGSSEAYSDFSCIEAYKKYGFTSYPFATPHGSPVILLSQLKEVLRLQSPQLIVIEINCLLDETFEEGTEDSNIRNYLDNMPMSVNKLSTVFSIPKTDTAISYIFPFAKYHALKSLSQLTGSAGNVLTMKKRGFALLRGFYTSPFAFGGPDKLIDVSENNETLPLDERTEGCLAELLDYCDAKEIKNVLFVCYPHCISELNYDRSLRANYAGEYISSRGYDFINFEKEWAKIGLDAQKDFYNLEHLNINGERKFTRYFCDILKERYDISGREQSEKTKADWEQSVKYMDALYRYTDEKMVYLEKNEEHEETYLYETSELISTLGGYLQ